MTGRTKIFQIAAFIVGWDFIQMMHMKNLWEFIVTTHSTSLGDTRFSHNGPESVTTPVLSPDHFGIAERTVFSSVNLMSRHFKFNTTIFADDICFKFPPRSSLAFVGTETCFFGCRWRSFKNLAAILTRYFFPFHPMAAWVRNSLSRTMQRTESLTARLVPSPENFSACLAFAGDSFSNLYLASLYALLGAPLSCRVST